MKRSTTDLIVIHCSATKPSQDIGVKEITEWHVAKGWAGIGYHFVIRRDGQIELGRPLEDVGAHVQGHNSTSVGICMVGGLTEAGEALTEAPLMFTRRQWQALKVLLTTLLNIWPEALIRGHRDMSPDLNHDGKIQPSEWLKTCPGFDVQSAVAAMGSAL